MYNQRVSDVDKELHSYGVHIPSRASVKQQTCMPLWVFRERNIPEKGLWAHYFHCTQCEWERRKIATCRYCDRPMKEIGGLPVVRVGEVTVYRVELPKDDKPKEVRSSGGIKVFRLTDVSER